MIVKASQKKFASRAVFWTAACYIRGIRPVALQKLGWPWAEAFSHGIPISFRAARDLMPHPITPDKVELNSTVVNTSRPIRIVRPGIEEAVAKERTNSNHKIS